MTLTRLPTQGVVGVELFAAGSDTARWDVATWAGPGDTDPDWVELGWQPIECQVLEAEYTWGADRAQGVLTQAAAGAVLVNVYDPDRLLDPANASSPYAFALRPGAYIRLVTSAGPLRSFVVDSITFDIATSRGRIAGTDGVGILSQVQLTLASPAIKTLYAFAADLLARSGWDGLITLEATPAAGDPTIGEPDTAPSGVVGVWAALTDAAQDALCFAYIDESNVLRFPTHADPLDRGFTIGCEGIPGLSLVSLSNADGVYNQVSAKNDPGGATTTVSDQDSIDRFGLKVLDRTTRRVPLAASWAPAVLADRKRASLEYLPVRIIPADLADLESLRTLRGIELVRVRFDEPVPPVEIDARAIGGRLAADPDGWVGEVLTYISDNEWTGGITPEPPDPEPPPATQTVTRSYVSAKAARISLTNTGAKYGAGAQTPCPVGYHPSAGWQERLLIDFPTIDWSDVVELVSATLRLQTSRSQTHTSYGSSPRIRVYRLTSSWSEGSASSPGSGNSVVWPGPSATTTGEATKTVPASTDQTVDVDITAIARAWAPAAAGGSGQARHGVRVMSYAETNPAYTTEFITDDDGTSADRPELRLTVKIPA